MIKGIYASGAGMQPRMLRLEVIGNNLANINTTGFKKDSIFVQVLREAAAAQANGDGELAGLDVKEFTDFSEGSLNQTNNRLDLAIQGSGFFTIQTPAGLRYTRNGNFMLSAGGTVVTSQGFPVLAKSGRIQLPDLQRLTMGNLTIDEQGNVILDRTPIAQLRIANVDSTSMLKKDGNALFYAEGPVHDVDPNGSNCAIRQGYLEESNVEGVEEMVQMVELSRSFESDQKSVQYQDGTLEKAFEVGRL